MDHLLANSEKPIPEADKEEDDEEGLQAHIAKMGDGALEAKVRSCRLTFCQLTRAVDQMQRVRQDFPITGYCQFPC